MSRTSSEGKEHIIRLAQSGDVLGYRSMIENAKYTASAIALDDTEACFVSGTDFNRIVDDNVKVANDLLKMLARALGETQDQFTHLAMKPVYERLAEALLLLKKTYGQEGPAVFSIAISREDLAALVGTAKETVIRFCRNSTKKASSARRAVPSPCCSPTSWYALVAYTTEGPPAR